MNWLLIRVLAMNVAGLINTSKTLSYIYIWNQILYIV